jgi:hypothetical protein
MNRGVHATIVDLQFCLPFFFNETMLILRVIEDLSNDDEHHHEGHPLMRRSLTPLHFLAE